MIKIKKCPHGAFPEWTNIWEPIPGIEYIALRCKKQFCDQGNWDCTTEYFKNTENGRDEAVIDWNRRVYYKYQQQKDGG